MTSAVIYLDESGDLGWKFDKQHRHGGSSRYLTIAAVIIPSAKKHLPKRIIRDLYEEYRWPTYTERKWASMKQEQKKYFCKLAMMLAEKHPDIRYVSITVYKPHVHAHIREDGNKLYNYMIGLMLLDEMAKFNEIAFVPDPRSIKVKSGNSLSDYLQTQLWFEKNVKTRLNNHYSDSASSRGIQFADMLSGAVWQHFEDGNSDAFQLLQNHIKTKKLYFPVVIKKSENSVSTSVL